MENWSEEDQLIDIIISTINISTMDNGFDLKSKFGAIFIRILWFLPHGHVWCQNYVKMSNQFCESHSADEFRISMKNTMIAMYWSSMVRLSTSTKRTFVIFYSSIKQGKVVLPILLSTL